MESGAFRSLVSRIPLRCIRATTRWEMLIKNAKGKLPFPKGPIHESLESNVWFRFELRQ